MKSLSLPFPPLWKIQLHQTLYTFLVSLYITLPFNLVHLNSYNLLDFLSSIFSTFAIIFTILFIASYLRILFILLSTLLIFITVISSYFFYTYHVEINLNIIIALFNTNLQETLEVTNLFFILYILIFALLPSLLISCLKIKKIKISNFLIGVAIISISLLLANLIVKKDLKIYKKKNVVAQFIHRDITFQPIGFVVFFIKYLLLNFGNFTHKDLTKIGKYSLRSQPEPLHVVFIIGETSRVDHYALYGYKKDTNPHLAKIDNLVFFNKNTSCNTSTIASVTCLLSNIPGKNFRENFTYYLKNEVNSFIPIFNHLNFDTYFATTNSLKSADPMFHRFKAAQHIYYPSAYKYKNNITDLILLPYLKNFIDISSQKNKLIILHTIGSHYKYRARYSTPKWLPICSDNISQPSDCDPEELINDYDNTLLITDQLIAEAITILRDKNAILIFTSDHGENLGEINKHGQKTYFHGSNFDEAGQQEIHVPMMIWFSDKYLQFNGVKPLQNAKKLRNTETNHDFIFHSLLDCSGIKNDQIIDPSLSICSAK